MQLFRYYPPGPGQFVRVYIVAESHEAIDKDAVWEQIKRQARGIEPHEGAYYFDEAGEEQRQRDEWFKGWDDGEAWDVQPLVFCDTHY